MLGQEAKDLITIESLAEYLLGPELTRETLAAEHERSMFVRYYILFSNGCSNFVLSYLC